MHPANPDRAVEYLQHAATFFNDKDAQFELAKIYVGTRADPAPAGEAASSEEADMIWPLWQ